MSKWMAIAMILVAGIGTAVFLMARSQPATVGGQYDLQRDSGAIGWPADKTFAWSFKTPKNDSKPYGLSLRIRTMTSTIAAETNPVFQSQPSAMPATDAETEFGPGTLMMPGGQNGSGHVTVQLLDLRRIGVASSKPGQDLRLLANLSLGGASVDLPADRIFLPAGGFAGDAIRGEGTWAKDELYLMSFYIQNDRTLTRYDVLLEKSAEPPAR